MPTSGQTSTAFGEQYFSFLIDAAPDGILIADGDGVIVVANRQALALFGYAKDELIGRTVDDLLPGHLRAGHEAHRHRYQQSPQVRPMGVGLTLKAARKGGDEFPVEISLSPVPSGDDFMVMATVRDITARLDAEERLRQSQAALAEAEQVLAVADDRERIARDLHDTVIQRLFAAGLSLQATGNRADEAVRERIAAIVEDIDQTIREVRTAVFSLQASRPSDRGLRGLLLDVTGEAHEPLGFEPRVSFDGPVETIDERIAEQLIPVLREALSNVARHAQARDVRVSVSVGHLVELSVADDGIGLSDTAGSGNGLQNLGARAAAMGGAFEIARRQGGGTLLRWAVPRDEAG